MERLLTLKRKHETEEELARRCGLSPSILSKWRYDQQGVSLRSLINIRAATGCSLEWLAFGKEKDGDRTQEAVEYIVRQLRDVIERAVKAYLPVEDISPALVPDNPISQSGRVSNRHQA